MIFNILNNVAIDYNIYFDLTRKSFSNLVNLSIYFDIFSTAGNKNFHRTRKKNSFLFRGPIRNKKL